MVHIYKPIIWNEYKAKGDTYKGYQNYIKVYDITEPNIKKEIKDAFDMKWVKSVKVFNDKWFDFNTMWFVK